MKNVLCIFLFFMNFCVVQAVKIERFYVNCKANIKPLGFDCIHTLTPLPNKQGFVISDNEGYVEIWNWHTNTREKSLDIKGKCIKEIVPLLHNVLVVGAQKVSPGGSVIFLNTTNMELIKSVPVTEAFLSIGLIGECACFYKNKNTMVYVNSRGEKIDKVVYNNDSTIVSQETIYTNIVLEKHTNNAFFLHDFLHKKKINISNVGITPNASGAYIHDNLFIFRTQKEKTVGIWDIKNDKIFTSNSNFPICSITSVSIGEKKFLALAGNDGMIRLCVIDNTQNITCVDIVKIKDGIKKLISQQNMIFIVTQDNYVKVAEYSLVEIEKEEARKNLLECFVELLHLGYKTVHISWKNKGLSAQDRDEKIEMFLTKKVYLEKIFSLLEREKIEKSAYNIANIEETQLISHSYFS